MTLFLFIIRLQTCTQLVTVLAIMSMENNFDALNISLANLSLQSGLIFAVLCLLLHRLFWKAEPVVASLPPGPSCLPFIGNVHKLGGTQMHSVTAKLAREQFGGVMTINLSGMKAVMITELKAIKEAYVDKAEIFSDRFQHPLTDYVNGGIPGK